MAAGLGLGTGTTPESLGSTTGAAVGTGVRVGVGGQEDADHIASIRGWLPLESLPPLSSQVKVPPRPLFTAHWVLARMER